MIILNIKYNFSINNILLYYIFLRTLFTYALIYLIIIYFVCGLTNAKFYAIYENIKCIQNVQYVSKSVAVVPKIIAKRNVK